MQKEEELGGGEAYLYSLEVVPDGTCWKEANFSKKQGQ